jgi:hypothetical protein
MNATKCILFFGSIFMISSIAFSQNEKGFEKIQGCWMESGEKGLTYESIFIFNASAKGAITGTAYFYNSEEEAFEYSISSIKLSGDTLVFVIDETSIFFEGLLNAGRDGITGYLVLDEKTRLSVSHQKVDTETFRSMLPKGKLFDERVIKKQIDAGAGLDIGELKSLNQIRFI